MRTLALSGWGQPPDALAAVAPDAAHADYAQYTDIETSVAYIAQAGKGCELVIGWSLGGQMAVRAIAEKRLQPKWLVLIAAPFQYLATPDFPAGMGRGTFEKYRANVARNQERALRKGWELIAHGDDNSEALHAELARLDRHGVFEREWLEWLHALEHFSCAGLDFSGFPATLLVHGKNDVVSHYAQSQAFAERMPARLELWDGCGHAPHWHDAERLKKLIGEFARV